MKGIDGQGKSGKVKLGIVPKASRCSSLTFKSPLVLCPRQSTSYLFDGVTEKISPPAADLEPTLQRQMEKALPDFMLVLIKKLGLINAAFLIKQVAAIAEGASLHGRKLPRTSAAYIPTAGVAAWCQWRIRDAPVEEREVGERWNRIRSKSNLCSGGSTLICGEKIYRIVIVFC